jgi:glycerol dehydratase large subunit
MRVEEKRTIMKSKRFEALAKRPVNQETFIKPLPELGFVVIGSPLDPKPSLVIKDGIVTEMDGLSHDTFDIVDRFIAANAIDLTHAERAMNTPSVEIARMIVDIHVSRSEILKLTSGCTPAKLVDIVDQMNVLEMMMGLAKMPWPLIRKFAKQQN